MVTHDLDSLFSVTDRIAVLGQKRIIAVGDMQHMLAQDDPWITSYFKGERARTIPAFNAAMSKREQRTARTVER
jgi:phospholipid/cholesterol/gamma-HCH transport system ATP-binding protein